MQAITTKYLPFTNTKPSRIKATCAAKSKTISYDFGLNEEERHRAAAMALIEELEWQDHGEWIGGCLKDGSYAFVCKSKWE